MFNEQQAEDYSPITVIGRFSIYLTELLVILHVSSMVVFTLWATISGQKIGHTVLDLWLSYDPGLIVGKFQVWRLLTYSLQDYPSLFFAFAMLMLWWFGREVERFYGRRSFLQAYLCLILVPAVVALIPQLNTSLVGPGNAHFGVFLMFAATYPGVALFFNITARIIAWVYLGISTMVFLADRDWTGLFHLGLLAFVAYGLTRWMGRGEWFPEFIQNRLPSFRRNPAFSVVRPDKDLIMSEPELDPVSSIDPILDKISQRGIGSLTSKERAALRAASGELQRKGNGK